MKKTQLAMLAAALGMATQARAAMYDITYTETDGQGSIAATGWLDVNAGVADEGQLTVTGGANSGTFSLVTGQDLNTADVFTYDNLVSPGSSPFLNLINPAGGLLWANGGTEFNMWYNTPAEAIALNGYANDVPNAYGLWGYSNGNYAPQSFGSATLTAVPEASTMLAGALMLLPLGVSAVRIMRKNVMV
jgi:hypothetical protein